MQRSKIIELARKNGATIEARKQPGAIIYEGTGGITFEVLERTVNAAISAEREACATECESAAQRLRLSGCGHEASSVEVLADDIRERSNE